jgi:outer membrane lipoprotein-sorting protein
MKSAAVRLAVAVAVAVVAAGHAIAAQQTAEDVIERSLKAMGGRDTIAKLQSRSASGTIVLSTPAGDIAGTIEILNARPNKTRTVIKADLSSLGAGELVVDQRFDGSSGYILDSLQGNREMTGGQLQSMKNNAFPHPFLAYKDLGTAARLEGKEKVGNREAYVIVFDPTNGAETRTFIDAETYLPIKSMSKIEIPQLGQEVEQTTEFLDYKDVDGIKIPHELKSSSTVQSFTVTLTKVAHNVKVDDSLFVKPGA